MNKLKKIIVHNISFFKSIIVFSKRKIATYSTPYLIRKIKKSIYDKVANNQNINILFVVQYPEMWNSLKTVYEAFNKNKNYKVTILCVPKISKSNILQKKFYQENEAYNYFVNEDIPCINALKETGWLKISELLPDYVFIQRPYDAQMPKEYTTYTIRKYGLICYIPYGYEFVNGKHLEIEYNDDFLANVYMIFCENKDTYNYCLDILSKSIVKKEKQVKCVGYPKFDLLYDKLNKQRKTVLWLPRWSIENSNDKTGFFNYYNSLVSFFRNHGEYDLIIRPHPLMFKNFIDLKIISANDYKKIMEEIEKINNISFDKNIDYLVSLSTSDILISDFTSLLIEFFIMKKPIIYCGKTNHFNSVGKEMEKGLYLVDDKDLLIDRLEKLLTGNDCKVQIYNEIACKLNNSHNSGEKICFEINKDANNK